MQPADPFSLSRKTIVVTGATGVLGSVFAQSIAAAGANVAVLGRNTERAEKVVNQISLSGGNAISVIPHVLKESELINARDLVLKHFGQIDGLVNAAGGNMPGAVVQPEQDVFQLNIAALREVMELNLFGTVLPTQVFGASMVKTSGKGSIVNISSVSAVLPLTKVLGYSLAKAAIESYTKWFSVELAKRYGDQIRMNTLVPGFFLTEQNKSLLMNEDGSFTQRGLSVISNTPFNRFGEPGELSGALVWLLSDASKFVTGTAVKVDGGFTAFSGV